MLDNGSSVKAMVLDVSKEERLVDLSLRPELIKESKEGSSQKHASKKVESLYYFTLYIAYFSM